MNERNSNAKQVARCNVSLFCTTRIVRIIICTFSVMTVPSIVTAIDFRIRTGDVAGLINAIDMANRSPGSDRIMLESGVYTLTAMNNETDGDGPNGLPSITGTLTISSPLRGLAAVIERAADVDPFRIFHVGRSGSVALINIIVRGGDAGQGQGGGLLNHGITIPGASTFSGNKAFTGGAIFNSDTGLVSLAGTIEHNTAERGGGGIMNNGQLLVSVSTIRNNRSAVTGGGGIFNDGGAATLQNSSVIGNSSGAGGGAGGGGIRNTGGGTLTITNSTISGNENLTGNGRGGGINNANATLNLRNVTITKNQAQIAGGGVFNSSIGMVNFKNSIIAGNTRSGARPDDCSGTLTSLGVNLIRDTSNCTVNGGTLVPGDPRPGPLANNGGFTVNHILLFDSDALEKGSEAVPGSGGSACEARDQRGVARPQNGDNVPGAICDLGAVEVEFPPRRSISEFLVTFEPRPDTFKTIESASGCPPTSSFSGKFEFSARLRNITNASLSNLVVGIRSFGASRGLLLQNADGGPGGIGAGMTVPQRGDFQDGELFLNEFVDVPFSICLQRIEPFQFSVDLFGGVR